MKVMFKCYGIDKKERLWFLGLEYSKAAVRSQAENLRHDIWFKYGVSVGYSIHKVLVEDDEERGWYVPER